MVNANRHPVVERAVRFLRREADRIRSAGERRLPPTAALAAAAGVSLVTMWKAVGLLKAEGLLIASRGRWIELAPQEDALTAAGGSVRPVMRAPKWKRIAERMLVDVTAGSFAPAGQIPAVKELISRYGASSHTIAQALRNLCRTGVIQPYKRHFRMAEVGRRHGRATIALVVHHNEGEILAHRSPRSPAHLGELETACSRRGIRLALVPYESWTDTLRPAIDMPRLLVDGSQAHASLMGVMVWTIGMNVAEHVRGLLCRLATLNRPVAVLDEAGDKGLESFTGLPRNVRLFSMAATPLCGSVVARFLVAKGHRHVAYLSPFHAQEWSQLREHGLARALHQVPGATLCSFTAPGYSFDSVSDTALQRVLADVRLRIASCMSAADCDTQAAAVLRQMLAEAPRTVHMQQMIELMEPLFAQALRSEQVTAWVGANDDIALHALSFLARHRRQVPQDVSVVGFDNTPSSILAGLSSYDFDGRSMINAMVSFLTGAAAWRELSRATAAGGASAPPAIEFEGHVVQRRTTAAARRR